MAKQKSKPEQINPPSKKRLSHSRDGKGKQVQRRGLPPAACRHLVQLRTAQGLNQKEMAEKCGLSAPYLCEIENGTRKPSVEVLLGNIGPGYGITDPLKLLVESNHVSDKPVVVVKKGIQLQALRVSRGLVYKGLSGLADERMSWEFAELEGHFDSGKITHHGEELILVIQGMFHLTVGEEEHVLREGEFAHYQSTTPHRLVNPDPTTTRVLVVRYPAHYHSEAQ